MPIVRFPGFYVSCSRVREIAGPLPSWGYIFFMLGLCCFVLGLCCFGYIFVFSLLFALSLFLGIFWVYYLYLFGCFMRALCFFLLFWIVFVICGCYWLVLSVWLKERDVRVLGVDVLYARMYVGIDIILLIGCLIYFIGCVFGFTQVHAG